MTPDLDAVVPSPIFGPLPGQLGPADTFTGFFDYRHAAGPTFSTTRTILWSHVVDVPQFTDPIAPLLFSDRSNHYRAATLGASLLASVEPGSIVVGPAKFELDPELCPECPVLIDAPNWIVQPTRISVAGLSGERDLTGVVSPSARAALLDPTTRWLTPSETGGWVRRGEPLLAGVDPTSPNVRFVAAARAGKLIPVAGERGRPPLDGGALLARAESAAACDLVSPCPAILGAPREDAGIVLSAQEAAVYWVGGADGATLHGDLLRFDVATEQYRRVALTGATPTRVLAAVYRPNDRSLYVVDRVTLGGWLHFARLLRIEPISGHAQLLGLWPRTPARDRVYLTNSPNGGLLLLSSSSSQKRYWVVDLVVGDALHVRRFRKGKGTVALPPTLTGRGLTLPLLEATGLIRNHFVPMADLGSGKWKDLASCL